MTVLRWLGVFLLMAAVDFAWASYTRAVAGGSRGRASLYSVFIVVLGAFATFSWVHDLTLLVPTAAGAYVGTWLSMEDK